jgi:hypothetical protein
MGSLFSASAVYSGDLSGHVDVLASLCRCCWIAASRRQGICEQESEVTVVDP